MRNIVKKSLFIVISCLLASTLFAEDMYVVSGSCNVPLVAGMNNAKQQMFVWDGTTANVTTDVSCNITGQAGFYYNSTSLAYADITAPANYSSSSSSNRTIKALKIPTGTTLTVSAPGLTFSKVVVAGRCASNDPCTLNVGGETVSTNNKDPFVKIVEKSFVEKFEISNNSGKEYNVIIYLFEGQPALSSDATLKSISYYSDGQYVSVPDFDKDILNYDVELPANYVGGAPSIDAKPTHENATVNITQATSLSETAIVKVTAEDEETTLTYTVSFYKASPLPRVDSIFFPNQKGTVEIVHGEAAEYMYLTDGTISAKIKHGCDLTAITPTFKGKNIVSWEDQYLPKDFSNGPVSYTFDSPTGPTATYSVTITEAEEVLPTGIQLDQTTLPLDEGETATLVATVLPEDADNKTVTWSSSNTDVATVENGIVTAIAEGETTITVTSQADNNISATCVVTVKEASSVPETNLSIHSPEVYEESVAEGGWGGSLSDVGNDEYEVFYFNKLNSVIAVGLTPLAETNIATGSTANSFSVKGNWMEGKSMDVEGSSSGGTVKAEAKDEFKTMYGSLKMANGAEYSLHVKGYSQFSIMAKDNGTTPNQGKDRWLKVYIDGEEVTRESERNKDNPTIRRYDINPQSHHLITVKGDYTSNCYTYALSLRVANNPLVRYKSGPQTQTVYQTKDIQPVTFLVRRAKAKRLTWKDNKAIDGIQLVAGGGDTVRIAGIANAEIGTYTYTLEALDENGNVASSESGTITIETKIFDSRNNDRETNIAEPIKPIDFVYYGLHTEDLSLSTDITGLELSFRDDSICSLVGTPAVTTLKGEHTYTISIAGGNSVSGTITINVPDPYFEQTEAKIRDEQQSSFTILAHHADEVTIEGLPEGLDYQYNRNTDQITVSGKTQVGDPYPHIDTLILTATPRYEGKETVTVKGVLTIIAPDAKAVLLIHKDLESDRKDAVADCLYDLRYDLTLCQQDAIENTSLDAIDLIVISQNADANHEAILNLIRSDKKPMLNLNGFTYSSDRLGWGEPYNGTVNEDHKASLFVQRDDHPIFKDWKPQGKEVNLFETVPNKGIMPIKVDGTVTECMGSLCIATAYTRSITDYFEDGELQTEIHEIPLPKRLNKYICFPIASDVTLSDDGKKIIERTAKYLLSEEPCIQRPGLQIMSFSLAGYAALPQEGEPGSIIIDMTKEEFRALDSLRSATPEITLMDPDHTFLTPTKPMDFRFANLVPVIYTVTDYINIHTYEVTIDVPYEQGIDEVYTSGEWVMIYDIYGRSVATTNEDIYSMTLPRGIYIVITENGNTIKLFK